MTAGTRAQLALQISSSLSWVGFGLQSDYGMRVLPVVATGIRWKLPRTQTVNEAFVKNWAIDANLISSFSSQIDRFRKFEGLYRWWLVIAGWGWGLPATHPYVVRTRRDLGLMLPTLKRP